MGDQPSFFMDLMVKEQDDHAMQGDVVTDHSKTKLKLISAVTVIHLLSLKNIDLASPLYSHSLRTSPSALPVGTGPGLSILSEPLMHELSALRHFNFEISKVALKITVP